MAKKQTRRSISLNRDLYDQAKAYAEHHSIPLAQLAENALRAAMAPAVPAASPQVSQTSAPKLSQPVPRADDFGDATGHPVADPVVEYDTP